MANSSQNGNLKKSKTF